MSTRKLIELPREYLIIMMEAGYVYLAMRRMEEAREIFEGMSVLAPKSEMPLIGLGNAYCAELQYEAAMKAYRKALKVEPDSVLARAYIGELLLLTGEKEKGVAELKEVIEKDTEGKATHFAKALLEAVEKGVLPPPKLDTEQFLKNFPLPLPTPEK